MTTLITPPVRLPEPTSPRSIRDSSVDVARAWCLVIVVALHALMVGVSVADGAPVFENAMDGWPWFAAATWYVQIMPLFFVLGGFSSATQWTKLRSRGVPAHTYFAMRLRRLLPPALGAIAVTAAALLALDAAGLPDDMVATAGFRLSQPLWFLGVYLLCTGLVPLMTALHRAAPRSTFAGLAALVIGVDVARGVTGIAGLGFANLLFVWLLVQQLGFWLAEGRFDRVSRGRLVVIAASALGVLAALCAGGVYSFDLLQNLNPPTFALVLLGVAQLAVFQLVRPALRHLHARRSVASAVGAINARAMTIYSWHMLVLIGLAGVLLVLVGEALPAPLTDAWWATRGAWLVTVGVVVTLVVAVAGRLETAPTRSARPWGFAQHPAAATVALLAAAGAVLVVLLAGSTPLAWVIAAAALAGSLAIARHVGDTA
jgi:peptidoglycan/LPS O-acetylase OafA/YrhL